MLARAAEMQKMSTRMTLVAAPWVSRAIGESASAPSSRPMRPRWRSMITTTVRTVTISST